MKIPIKFEKETKFMTRMTQGEVDAHNAKFMKPIQQSQNAVEDEMGLHAEIIKDLKNRRWYYVRSRSDKRSTNQIGTPDFIIAKPDGKTLWIECKRKGGKLSVEQNVVRHVLLALNHSHHVVFNMEDYGKAINQSPTK